MFPVYSRYNINDIFHNGLRILTVIRNIIQSIVFSSGGKINNKIIQIVNRLISIYHEISNVNINTPIKAIKSVEIKGLERISEAHLTYFILFII